MKRWIGFGLVILAASCGKQSDSSDLRFSHNGGPSQSDQKTPFEAINQYVGNYQVKSSACQDSTGSTACAFGTVDQMSLAAQGQTFQMAFGYQGRQTSQSQWHEYTQHLGDNVTETTYYYYDRSGKIAYYNEEQRTPKVLVRKATTGFFLRGPELHLKYVLWNPSASITWSKYEIIMERLKP